MSGSPPSPSSDGPPVRPDSLLAPLGQEEARSGEEDSAPMEGDGGNAASQEGERAGAPDPDEEPLDDEEGRAPVLRRSPASPSRQEVEEHMATHIPFREWCEHCVRGRGRNDPHKVGADDRREDPVPTIAMDCGFMRSKEGGGAEPGEQPDSEQCGPMLVVKNRKEGNMFATIVPAKGAAAPWICKRVGQWIEQLGYRKVVLKTDGERAIVSLAHAIRSWRGQEANTVLEHPERGESQSNAGVESAVGTIEGMVRTIKDGLERRIGRSLRPTEAVIPWLVEHASHLYSRYKVGADGRTPLERIRGRSVKRPICELGEQILYMPLKAGRGGKFDARFRMGTYLGTSSKNGESIVGTEEGAVGARTVRRLPAEKRWDSDAIGKLKGLPWAPAGEQEEAAPVAV